MFFGPNIKYLRALKGITQGQLAKEMEVTSQAVTGWESGKSFPYFQVLLQLREYFQVDLERLVYHDLQKETVEENSERIQSGSQSKMFEMVEALRLRVEGLERRVTKIEGKP